MYDYQIELLKKLREERPTYKDMIDFCCDNMIMSDIRSKLYCDEFYFEPYSGKDFYYVDDNGDEITEEEYNENGGDYEYLDVYQEFIIGNQDAERLAEYTNEIVLYCERLDMYILCVTHWGTPWNGVDANWKAPEECEIEAE